MSDEDLRKLAEGVANDMAFVVNFAKAATKLRDAERAGTGVTLTYEETTAIVKGLRLLRQGAAGE